MFTEPRCILKLSAFVLLLLAGCAFLRCASAQAPADGSLTSNPVYIKNCAKCHGKAADGRLFGGPSLVSDNAATTPPDTLRQVISNGKGHMPKYAGKLTPEEIDTLVQQIKSRKPKS
jgi:mono/diheme cytochrome c family protein